MSEGGIVPKMEMLGDTIAAISTPPGEGGIGIIRISGQQALDIARRIIRKVNGDEWKNQESWKLGRGRVVDNRSGEIIDEVLISVMKAPKSYTREDTVEINCHGGIIPLVKTLELLLINGARIAEPGEFTRRAFLNGRIDLAQAESVLDVIRAKTSAGLKLAISQLEGSLSRKIRELQEKLLNMLAHVEASIDFPEEVSGENLQEELDKDKEKLVEEIEDLLRGAEIGKILREGLLTVIAGKPNVGKSSLLNMLLKENKAIVTEIPGTTRDIIEDELNIRGIPLRIADTAGLRKTMDKVEKIGVARTREFIKKADLVMLVLDDITGLTDEDMSIIKLTGDKKCLVLINKIDAGKGKIKVEGLNKIIGKRPVIKISALRGDGIKEIEEKIHQMVLGGEVWAERRQIVSNMRHKVALEKAKNSLLDVGKGIRDKMPVDIIAIDLKSAWESLGEITGETVNEDIIDKIFADFCIGK